MRLSQALRHSAMSQARTCAPGVIVYFRSFLESQLGFRSSGCRLCAVDIDAIFPLFACLACQRGCLAVFLCTILCLIVTTTLVLLSELLLSELDSGEVENVPHLLLPSHEPMSGWKCYVTRVFSGVPIKEGKTKTGT